MSWSKTEYHVQGALREYRSTNYSYDPSKSEWSFCVNSDGKGGYDIAIPVTWEKVKEILAYTAQEEDKVYELSKDGYLKTHHKLSAPRDHFKNREEALAAFRSYWETKADEYQKQADMARRSAKERDPKVF